MFIQEVVNTQTMQLEDELEQRNALRILLRNFKENNSQNKKKGNRKWSRAQKGRKMIHVVVILIQDCWKISCNRIMQERRNLLHTKHTGNKNKIGLKWSRIQILDSVEMHAFNADQEKKYQLTSSSRLLQREKVMRKPTSDGQFPADQIGRKYQQEEGEDSPSVHQLGVVLALSGKEQMCPSLCQHLTTGRILPPSTPNSEPPEWVLCPRLWTSPSQNTCSLLLEEDKEEEEPSTHGDDGDGGGECDDELLLLSPQSSLLQQLPPPPTNPSSSSSSHRPWRNPFRVCTHQSKQK